jgi:hypothetical protein
MRDTRNKVGRVTDTIQKKEATLFCSVNYNIYKVKFKIKDKIGYKG